MKMNKSSLLCIAVLSFSGLIVAQDASPRPSRRHALASRRLVSAVFRQSGREGRNPFHPSLPAQGLVRGEVPTTVVAALVKHKVYPDPFFGTNLRSFPGVTYPIGANFSNIPMQPDSPFIVPWWYRKEFVLPAELQGQDASG